MTPNWTASKVLKNFPPGLIFMLLRLQVGGIRTFRRSDAPNSSTQSTSFDRVSVTLLRIAGLIF